MSFAHPILAIAAIVCFPVALLAQRTSFSLGKRFAVTYSNLAFLTEALQAPAWPCFALDAIGAGALAALLLAGAGPRYSVMLPETATVVLCIDTSGSMRSADIAPSRATVALHALRSFVLASPGSRIGIISFAGSAQRILKPTLDRNAVLAALSALPSPNGQTAIGDGLDAAISMLPAQGTRRIVLISDGANNRGEDPATVMRRLHASDVQLAVVGIGGAGIPERALRSYASQGAGSYARVRNFADFQEAIAHIVAAAVMVWKQRDCSEVFAFAGLFLMTAAWLGSQRGAFAF